MGLMDKAAACVVAYNYVSQCPEKDTKKQLCKLICCCNTYPIIKTYFLKQLCVDRLLQATDSAKDGILPSVPYDMEPRLPQVIRDVRNFPGNIVAARLKKLLTGEYFQNRIRIPDVTVLSEPTGSITAGNIKKIYEIKFPNDTPRDGQIADYGKIVGGDGKRVEILHVEDCHCEDMPDKETVEKIEAEEPDLIKRANANMKKFFEEHKQELKGEMNALHLGHEYVSLDAKLLIDDPLFFVNIFGMIMRLPVKLVPLGKFPVPTSGTPVPLPVLAP